MCKGWMLPSVRPTVMRYGRPLRTLALLAGLLPIVAPAAHAQTSAEKPVQFCRRVGTDDTLRPIPDSLVPAAQKLFGLQNMSRGDIQGQTQFRCANGRVLVCTIGANLPCTKANTSRNNPGATDFCRDNPQSDSVPAAATGHDTIYNWRCVNGKAQSGGPVEKVDDRGFFRRYWKPVT